MQQNVKALFIYSLLQKDGQHGTVTGTLNTYT